VKNKNEANKEEKLISLYLQTASMLDESLAVLSREKNEEKKKSEEVSRIFSTLPVLVQDSRLHIVAERNMLQANVLAAALDVEAIFTNENFNKMAPKNVIRHLEKAMQAY
jgi:hypothetical protein